jgi:CO/xanthine dehydrogenase FAD-binding subunit
LFSEPQPSLRRLFDLRGFGWAPLEWSASGLRIAGTCTLADLAAWRAPVPLMAEPLIGACCRALLGSFKIWNEATVGGNVCLALPAGPMTSLAAALDAVAEIWEPDGLRREVPVSELVLGPGRSALAPGALLRAIRLPISPLRSRAAFRQLSLSTVGRSAAVVIAREDEDGAFVLTVTAAVPRPMQLRFACIPSEADLAQALDRARLDYYDDVHGDPRWRAQLTRVFAQEVRAELSSRGR